MNFQPLHDLMQKQVTRKDFLKYLGFGLISIFGINSILSNFTAKVSAQETTAPTCDSSYGAGTYGH